ncbi:unnamed protein product [Caretta caretta]
MEGLMVNLVNVYAPTSGPEWLQFYQQASTFLSTLDSHECLVLGGDFNTTLEDRRRNAATEQLEREVLELERHLAASPEDLLLCGVCREKREEFRALEDHRAGGTFVRSRIRLLQEKAFNRVDHGYLLSTLQAFGFGLQFVGFLRVLYASAESLVKLNWTLTKPVSFGRLTGLVLWEPELRLVLSAYADDVLLVIQDPGNLARVEACQAIYSAASSTRVNWVKSSGLAVGNWRQRTKLYKTFTDNF